jgi:hypothetical protein
MKLNLIFAFVFLSLISHAQQDQSKENNWKLKFHFGYTRTNYLPTDVTFDSTELKGTVRDVNFVERTSEDFYNPFKAGRKITDALKWIDEPTNTMSLSIENDKNAIYLTAFHPKFLKSFLYEKKTNESGEVETEFSPIGESDSFAQVIPEGKTMAYIGNTHKRMDWTIGYGRKIKLFNTKDFGVMYVPRVDFGFSVGKARSVRIVPGQVWDDNKGKIEIQGGAMSVGHRLEVYKGRLSLFIDQRLVYSTQTHGFYDGTVSYKLMYIPTTFGMSYQLFEFKRKPKAVAKD